MSLLLYLFVLSYHCSFHLDHCGALPWFLEKVWFIIEAISFNNCLPPFPLLYTRLASTLLFLWCIDYVQGACVHDPSHQGHLQVVAIRLYKSQQHID